MHQKTHTVFPRTNAIVVGVVDTSTTFFPSQSLFSQSSDKIRVTLFRQTSHVLPCRGHVNDVILGTNKQLYQRAY